MKIDRLMQVIADADSQIAKIYKALNSLDHQHAYSQQLAAWQRDMASVASTVSATMQRTLEPMQEVVRHIATAMQGFMPDMERTAKGISHLCDRFPVVMLELGWPPHLDLDFAEMRWVVDAYTEKGVDAARGDIEAYLLQRYDEAQVQRLLASWSRQKWLAHRMPILRGVIQAHVAGDYWLSIPALLPQIEGIVAERYGHTGKITYPKITKYLQECLATDQASIMSRSDETVQTFFTNVVLAGFEEWLQPPQSTLSRHSILHGHDTAYGTHVNSLKAILLFDYLRHRLCRLLGTRGGECYHVVGCNAIDLTRTDLVSYKNWHNAEAAGKRPCKRCKPR